MTEGPEASTVRVGTAGWTIPRGDQVPGFVGTHLQQYTRQLSCAEINTSFYRSHRTTTWVKWASTTPPDFRFSVKLPRTITHDARLSGPAGQLLLPFLEEVRHLDDRLGPLLVQLPPSLAFDAPIAESFFDLLRTVHAGAIACEARHASWFDAAVDVMLGERRIARVAADPAVVPGASMPGGWPGLVYMRLHGSPERYRSPYSHAALRAYAERLADRAADRAEVWCTFDNTASGAAFGNALELHELLGDIL